VIVGAPWMIKSVESAMPWPKRFMAMAAPIAGRPARTATGKRMAPTRAVAGEGQKNQEANIMAKPTTQKATSALTISLAAGLITR